MNANLDKIERGRAGIIMPIRNAFDFTERPENLFADTKEKGKAKDPSRASLASIKKTMDGLKKKNRMSFANKNMKTVKLD